MKIINIQILFLAIMMPSATFAAHSPKESETLSAHSPKKSDRLPVHSPKGDWDYYIENTGIYCDLEVFDKSGSSLGVIKKNNLWDPYGSVPVTADEFPIVVTHRTVAGGWCGDLPKLHLTDFNCYQVAAGFFPMGIASNVCP